MAMHLRRNLGNYVAGSSRRFPTRFGGSLAGPPAGGGGAAAPPPFSARHFSSESLSSLRRDVRELRAAIKDLSRKDFFTLTSGTALLTLFIGDSLRTLPDDIEWIKNYTKSKLSIMRTDGESSGNNSV